MTTFSLAGGRWEFDSRTGAVTIDGKQVAPYRDMVCIEIQDEDGTKGTSLSIIQTLDLIDTLKKAARKAAKEQA